ncbi:MAG: bifunctional hydroxymethylpyrimidine kinase/phosphomethylpyrimidine kinase [Oscillospiraceae bacterium]|nr:bifunctional hydroxymethylpyrimidine kinase/phosphomethylpyrimidine kinase [Oscillospiraceae bacterium]
MLHENNYCAVVGGVNIDIGGRPFRKLIPQDSNPGKVSTSLGGVGRNIAHNMSLLGLNVRFLTAFGDDVYAQRIEASCDELSIDISRARRVSGASTSTYLYLNDDKGDMALAVSDMSICDEITPVYLSVNLDVLNRAKVVVADCNLSESALKFLTSHCTSPIFADPVSVSKAEKLKSCLGMLHSLKPNRIEAELLSGVAITDEVSLRKAAEKLLETGLRRVFITLGADGVYAADQTEEVRIPRRETEVRNTTGAGDAFMAALVWAYWQNLGLRESTEAANLAAGISSESQNTIHPELGSIFKNQWRKTT